MEKQSGQGLILRTGSHVAINCKMGEKLVDFPAPQLKGVDPFPSLIAVEDEEASNPSGGLWGHTYFVSLHACLTA